MGGPVPGSLKSHTAHDAAISLWKESDSHEKVKKQKLEGGTDLVPCLGTQGLGVDFEERQTLRGGPKESGLSFLLGSYLLHEIICQTIF